jgi:phosphopantetheine adenylyltransferase/dephospho-CoA kinase
MIERFQADHGADIADGSGGVDRAKLGPVVFGDPAAMALLNSLVWPEIARLARTAALDAAARLAAAPARPPFVFIEAAVLIEAGWDALVDEVWCVTAPRAVRIARVIER